METKDAYREKLEARLDQWQAEIDKLAAKADEAKADAKLKYLRQVEELRAMQDKARDQLEDLSNAQDAAWKDLKSGIESAWNELGKAVKSASERFG